MLDNKDIKKLIKEQKKVFATKKDLTGLKEDFATNKEIEYLIDIVATKEELVGVEKRLGVKIDEIGKGVKDIKTKLTEVGVFQ